MLKKYNIIRWPTNKAFELARKETGKVHINPKLKVIKYPTALQDRQKKKDTI